MIECILPFSDKSSAGASVLIQGVECGCISVPLHVVNLECNLVTGPVTVGIRPSLPIEGITFILGNDLAGEKVDAEPWVCNEPQIVKTQMILKKNSQVFSRPVQ